MSEMKKVYPIASLPGIKRDGTQLDGDNYADGQWCRFQRGRPKKMGGFMRITNQFSGPIRDILVWSRESLNAVYAFSPYGIEMLLVDSNGTGSQIIDRSPVAATITAGAFVTGQRYRIVTVGTTNFTLIGASASTIGVIFTATGAGTGTGTAIEMWMNEDHVVWSTDTQYDDAVGTTGTVVLAHASESLVNIDSTAASKPYLGLATGNAEFTQIADAPAVSGGVFSVAPYTIVHGSDGFVAWSDANQPQVWYTSVGAIGDAGADRVTGSKIVKGLALRSGSGPAALLWSLDSVIRMDYSGGTAVFKFTHLSTQSSILSQNCVIEYDGAYFWIGIDRFLVCDGAQVRELPNNMNLNWFFDNLNYSQRQKVWAMKVPRYGEIWWFFPFGDNEECSHAVIYNVRENTWYDTECARSAGFYSQVFHYPVMSGVYPTLTEFVFSLSSVTGTFSVGDVVMGANGAKATVTFVSGTTIRIHLLDSLPFTTGALTDSTSGATATIDSIRYLYSAFSHERGTDAIDGDLVQPIPSYFTTSDFGYPTGGAQANAPEGINRWTRLTRIEPDFVQSGAMDVFVIGREFANAPEKVSAGYNFTDATQKIDMREQRREIRLKFLSNVVGGHYEMGRPLLHTELGEVRS